MAKSTRATAEPLPKAPASIDYEMSKIWINAGKDVFGKADEALEFFIFTSGMDSEDFGTINLRDSHSIIEVRRDYMHDIISALDSFEWDGNRLQAKPARR